jgi:2-hydroxy-3-oxopropionate reductase
MVAVRIQERLTDHRHGQTITCYGGAGQIAKAANQIMVAAQMVAMGELLIFAKKAGADPQKVVEAIRGGAAQCWTLDVRPPRLFDGNRSPGFKAYMQAKDLGITGNCSPYGAPLPPLPWMPSCLPPCFR